MKLSIITAILDSHEIVRRQMLHYSSMNLPNDVEIVWVDDGSDPAIKRTSEMQNLTILRTDNKTPWSEHAARNLGVQMSKGDVLFCADIDYILPREAIEKARMFDGDRMDIRRRLAILNEAGEIDQSTDTLRDWGARKKYFGAVIPGHRSQYVMRREVFDAVGGYREDLAGQPHPRGGGPGNLFHGKWRRMKRTGKATLSSDIVDVFMFPTGKFCVGNSRNPHGLFHGL